MLKMNYGKTSYEIKSGCEELKIGEFEAILEIYNDPKRDYIDKWGEIFVICGIPEEIVDDLDSLDFLNLIKEFNLMSSNTTEVIKSIIIGDSEFVSYTEEFKITVKEMRLIEEAIKNSPNSYLADMLAIVYKKVGVNKELSYLPEHLKYKSELFRAELMTDVAIPFLGYITKKLIKDIKFDTAN